MRQIDDHKVKPYIFFFFLILFFYAKIRFMSLQGREMRTVISKLIIEWDGIGSY